MIERAKRIIKGAIFGLDEVDKTKAAGTHIYRPLYNAEEWATWIAASGLPNGKTAEELRVSILQITGQFQLVPNTDAHVFRTEICVFGIIGGKMVAAWYDYGYYDRHWGLREIVGYDCWCVNQRAMLVLSDDPGDFSFENEALLSVPRNIALGGERSEPLTAEAVITKSATAPAKVTPTDDQKEKAKAALLEIEMEGTGNPLAMARLFEISKGFPMVAAEATAELGADLSATVGLTDTPVVIVETQIEKTAEVNRTSEVQIVKKDNARQNLYGWTSVATVDGEVYEDLHGDTITVEALHQACTLIVKDGQNLGGVEHEETPNFIAASMVIDDEWAAAMSDNFYFEGDVLKTKKQGLFNAYHYVDKEDWEANKDLPLEFSLNGTAIIEKKDAS